MVSGRWGTVDSRWYNGRWPSVTCHVSLKSLVTRQPSRVSRPTTTARMLAALNTRPVHGRRQSRPGQDACDANHVISPCDLPTIITGHIVIASEYLSMITSTHHRAFVTGQRTGLGPERPEL